MSRQANGRAKLGKMGRGIITAKAKRNLKWVIDRIIDRGRATL